MFEQLQPFRKTITDDRPLVARPRGEVREAFLVPASGSDRYLAARQADFRARHELSKLSLYEIQARAKQVSAALGDIHIAEFDGAKVKTFLDSFPVTARTRVNIRLRLSERNSSHTALLKDGSSGPTPCEKIELRPSGATLAS